MSSSEPELKAPAGPKMSDGWYVSDEPLPDHPLERLAYYARLAPSSHNRQPWKFVIGESEIDLFADVDKWLRVADRDRREMFISLGCAIESIRIAADYAGYGTAVQHFPVLNNESLVARITVNRDGPKRDDAGGHLLRYMTLRHTNHRIFEASRPVSDTDRKSLYNASRVGEVALHLISDSGVLAGLAQIETRADAQLFADPDYRQEISGWLSRDLFGASWLLAKLGQLAIEHLPVAKRVGQADAARLSSSPLVGILSTKGDRRVDELQTGEAFLRIALVAERYDLRIQPVSQIVEVPETRTEAARLCGVGDRVLQHMFRIGHAQPDAVRTDREPLASLVVRSDGRG